MITKHDYLAYEQLDRERPRTDGRDLEELLMAARKKLIRGDISEAPLMEYGVVMAKVSSHLVGTTYKHEIGRFDHLEQHVRTFRENRTNELVEPVIRAVKIAKEMLNDPASWGRGDSTIDDGLFVVPLRKWNSDKVRAGLGGALRSGCREEVGRHIGSWDGLTIDVLDRACTEIRKFLGREPDDNVYSEALIHKFNDDPGTSYDDVIAILDAMIDTATEELS